MAAKKKASKKKTGTRKASPSAKSARKRASARKAGAKRPAKSAKRPARRGAAAAEPIEALRSIAKSFAARLLR